METTFGAYVAEKHIEKDVSYTTIAKAMGVGNAYLCDIVKGRRYPPESPTMLNAMTKVLKLSLEEKNKLFDLAARERGQVTADMRDYIMQEDFGSLRRCIRRAKTFALGDDFWKEVDELISRRIGKDYLCAEWISYMHAYRIYDPHNACDTIAYVDVENLWEAEDNAIEHGYTGLCICDADTMHVELY